MEIAELELSNLLATGRRPQPLPRFIEQRLLEKMNGSVDHEHIPPPGMRLLRFWAKLSEHLGSRILR